MISVAEALALIRHDATPLPSRRFPLGDALGLRLAADVVSDVDSPPFDKSLVDGYAIITADRSPTLREIELVTAGSYSTKTVSPGTTIRVMTGAPLPRGADAVVKVEDCEQINETAIRNPAAKAAPGDCVLKRAAAFQAGQTVLPARKRVGPLDVALLAEIGRSEIDCTLRPRVAVLPTGDELVEAHEPMGPGQIRNSNGPMLLAALAVAGAEPVSLGIGRDDPADLRERITRGLACDMLLVSGGVSAGVKDLVPGILAELGIAERFHQVNIKPGKPLWFGVLNRGALGGSAVARKESQALVFGLPGNPVSTLVSFKLFAEPAIAALAGGPFARPKAHRGTLAAAFKHRDKRPTYHPSRRLEQKGGAMQIEPLDWHGSADLATLTRADCLAVFPAGDYELKPGAEVDWIAL